MHLTKKVNVRLKFKKIKPDQLKESSALSLLAVGMLMTAFCSAVVAETAEKMGLAIATEADHRDAGFQDSSSSLTMLLINKSGESTTRQMREKRIEVQGDGDKSIMVFDEPRDVKGTALLTYSHKEGKDDQWLYLPALKRVKRISSSNKSGPFMGSEFSYEDLSSQEIEKYTYRYLGDENLNAKPCFVIERYPADLKSGYTRQVAWIDQEEYRTWKVDFYDRKNSLLKTLTLSEYKQYLGRYWRPAKLSMINHQTGKSTILQSSDYQFKNGFTERDFNKNSLAKMR